MEIKKESPRVEIRKQDDKQLYVVLYFKDEDYQWYSVRAVIKKSKLKAM